MSKAPLIDVFIAACSCRNWQSSRDAFILSLCSFLHRSLELRIYAVAPLATAALAAGAAPKQHVTEEAALLVAEDGTGQSLAKLSKKRQAYLRKVAQACWLFMHWRVLRKLLHHSRAGSLHVSLDAARAGGRESTLAVLYSCSENFAVWLPPQDPRSRALPKHLLQSNSRVTATAPSFKRANTQ